MPEPGDHRNADEEVLSAQVILRPRTGGGHAPEQLTAETIRAQLPDESQVNRAQEFFRSRGFDVGDWHAISFSITGRRSLFESTFGPAPSVVAGAAGVRSVDPGSRELDLSALPAEVTDAVERVGFIRPPDFGPGAP